MRIHIPLLLIFAGLIPEAADASKLDEAVEAMRIGNFAEAYCIMRPLADDGDADAEYNIGWMYLNGYGLRVNDGLALQWWEKASEQGHLDASFSIGMLYNLGEGEVSRDDDKAIDYYLLAAEGGQEDAITILQSMMLRNDKAIRGRMREIIDEHALLFGEKRQVSARKLNARKGPSLEDGIVTRLKQGDTVLEMYKQGKWSQVVVLNVEDSKRPEWNQSVWVYNPLLTEAAEESFRP